MPVYIRSDWMVWDGQRGGFADTMEANPEAEAMVLLNFHLRGGPLWCRKNAGENLIRQKNVAILACDNKGK